jgi:hypothetical protein
MCQESRDLVGDLLNFNVSITRRNRHSRPRFLLCPACSKRSLWSEDGLRTPITVFNRVEQNWRLERATTTENMFSAPHNLLKTL